MKRTNDFPKELDLMFRVQSCLKAGEEEGTWLCTEVPGGRRVIVKVAFTEEAAALHRNEQQILTRIHQTSGDRAEHFPEILASGTAGEFSYMARTFLPGMSLADYVETEERQAGLPRETALKILLSVLEQLQVLHRMDPPVIHRDIKPQNIIVESAGEQEIRVCLIDFGIARLFRKPEKEAHKRQDTVAMGTFHFAPPEQFGYRQTDARSDLYAAGVLLRYCLTQDYEESADEQIDADIREVIRRATQFDPENRYPDASEMIRDVQRLLFRDHQRLISRDHQNLSFRDNQNLLSRDHRNKEPEISDAESILRAEADSSRGVRKTTRHRSMLPGILILALLLAAGIGILWNRFGKRDTEGDRNPEFRQTGARYDEKELPGLPEPESETESDGPGTEEPRSESVGLLPDTAETKTEESWSEPGGLLPDASEAKTEELWSESAGLLSDASETKTEELWSESGERMRNALETETGESGTKEAWGESDGLPAAETGQEHATPLTETEVWEFREPLIEEAVRMQLAQLEGAITMGQLSQITSLHIFGKQVYRNEDEFLFNGEFVIPRNGDYDASGRWTENGGITSLEDLAAMPNLEEVCLYRQNISDVSGLFLDEAEPVPGETKPFSDGKVFLSAESARDPAEPESSGSVSEAGKLNLRNRKLTYLGLGYNPLTDLSVLSGNSQITGLNLSCLELQDLSFLGTLSELKVLVLAGYGSIQTEEFAQLPLEELNLVDTWPADEENLSHLIKLKKFTTGKLYPGLLQQLSRLPLTELVVNHTSGVVLADLQVLNGLQRLYWRVAPEDETEVLTEESLSFPNLQVLDLKGLQIRSFRALKGPDRLEKLGIYESDCLGWEGLDDLKNLTLLVVNSEQKEMLEERYPEHKWEYLINNYQN